MVQMLRVRSEWSGFSGAPGFTNFFFRDFTAGTPGGDDFDTAAAQAATAKTFQFWDGIQNLLPTVVRIDVDSQVDVIESTSGDLVNSFSPLPEAPVAGDAAGPYSGASGAVINWRTAGIRNSRRIRGRTFIVPLSNGAYGSDGQLTPATRGTLQTAANALASSNGFPDLGVFARPSSSTVEDGDWSVVTSASVPALAAILRSRRD